MTDVVGEARMIERVARAIHKRRQDFGYGGQAGWEFEPSDIQDLHMETARAAIAALREPTEAMNWAAAGKTGVSPGIAHSSWHAMIDTALTG